MNPKITFMLACLIFIGAGLVDSSAAPQRGAWCWAGSPTDDWGTTRFVGDPVREDAAIREFQRWDIQRMYGSYKNRVIDEPETIAAWNIKLHGAGLFVEMLLSENTWIFPDKRPNLLEVHVKQKLIDFNAARTNAAERFDALHLDIEPQGLPEWSSSTPAERKDLLNLLRDTFHDTREYLNTNGAAAIPIYAALPVWFDNYPGGSIGWDSAEERDQWFADIGTDLTGISLMPFERPTFSSISNGLAWEVANFASEVRVGLEASIGLGKTWPDFESFIAMARQIEAAFGDSIGIDIQSFKQFENNVPPAPTVLGSPAISGNSITLPISELTGGASNRIERCFNLRSNDWVSVYSFVSWQAETNWTELLGSWNSAFYRLQSD